MPVDTTRRRRRRYRSRHHTAAHGDAGAAATTTDTAATIAAVAAVASAALTAVVWPIGRPALLRTASCRMVCVNLKPKNVASRTHTPRRTGTFVGYNYRYVNRKVSVCVGRVGILYVCKS